MSISVPDGTPEELVETAESVSGYVTAAGGRILRSSNESPWGRRRLAYPIRHNSADLRDGFYTLYHFEIKPEGIEDIEREIRLNERIIRHLLLQLDNEPIFVEETEEVTAETDPETGETVITDETIAVAEVPAADEVEVTDTVDTAIVDAEGNVEAVDEEIEVVTAEPVEETTEDVTAEAVEEEAEDVTAEEK
jgi:small subunit ribosomal protein S6